MTIPSIFEVTLQAKKPRTLVYGNEYLFNRINDPFDSNDFIWNSKDITDGNSHLWHHKYSLPSTKVLGFVACRVT